MSRKLKIWIGVVVIVLIVICGTVLALELVETEISENDLEVVVQTWHGRILGSQKDKYYAFEKVRYAEPPLGVLRFTSPQPYREQWTEIRNHTAPGDRCLQVIRSNIMGTEDCLYMNIYTPSITRGEKFPVIVYIHGGAYMFGNGYGVGGAKIMATGHFVYVNINYRLGPLGFLSTEDDIIPGNYGLKDQVMALKWIQENIAAFNGNPENITVAGFSAGGASVHFHILRPNESKGLFSAAISHSGCALNPWSIVHNSKNKAKRLAESLKCPSETSKEILDCLRTKPGEEIAKTVMLFENYLQMPFTTFGPVIESKSVQDAFLTETPWKLIQSGNYLQVPWLLSYVTEDGGYNGGILMKQDANGVEEINKVDAIWNDLSPLLFFYNDTTEGSRKQIVTNQIRSYYLKDQPLNTENYWTVQKMLTDRLFATGIEKTIKAHSSYGNTSIYAYLYTRPTYYTYANLNAARNDINFGAVHGADLSMIAQIEYFPVFDTPEELAITGDFMQLYKSFSENGKPIYADIELAPVKFNEDKIAILQIDNSTSINQISLEHLGETDFWESILPMAESN